MTDQFEDEIPTSQQSETAKESTGPRAYGVDFPPPGPVAEQVRKLPLNRFYDVNVTVSVELGRVEMPIGEIVQLGETSIVELKRSISEEVDIMAQGVRIARGEVVVVDDRFAVRITRLDDEGTADL